MLPCVLQLRDLSKDFTTKYAKNLGSKNVKRIVDPGNQVKRKNPAHIGVVSSLFRWYYKIAFPT